MHSDANQARVLKSGCTQAKFKDGLQRTVCFASTAYTGVFAKLRDPQELNKLDVNGYFLTWPGELDTAPDAMHHPIAPSGEWIIF